MEDYAAARKTMVDTALSARGVRDELVLKAMGRVPREHFVPSDLKTLAYRDTPLPIGSDQTISQPYIVAFMIEALGLQGGEKVLEIGAGSGYAAAVLGEIAGEVYAIERIGQLAERAVINLMDAGYQNVHVRHDDGTRGWLDEAPFDAILVSAGAPDIPRELLQQLVIGGHMVIPVGRTQTAQELVRITRLDEDSYEREDLADVRFVPLIGKEGWESEQAESLARPARITPRKTRLRRSLPGLIAAAGEGFEDLQTADLDPLLKRIGKARLVLIGEASHGTAEFYRMRARITKALIEEKGFNLIAVEGDWPDIRRIDHFVRHSPRAEITATPEPEQSPVSLQKLTATDSLISAQTHSKVAEHEWTAFARFPTWMWRNKDVHDFIIWLQTHNKPLPYGERTAFYGLDLYSLYNSVRSITTYLDGVDPDLAAIARRRYGCLSPWEADPAAYGHAALSEAYRSCEDDVVAMLVDLLQKQQKLDGEPDEPLFDAVQNARLVKNAERYYRIMYYGSRASWNLRDSHMFESLQRILGFHGPKSKIVVWAHNSHVGDAAATEMSARGEYNIGQLCRREFGAKAHNIGFGTDHGQVTAASNWDGPSETMTVRAALPQSYEHQFHRSNQPGIILPLGKGQHGKHVEALSQPLLERAIGVIYRPETELASHYFQAVLPQQFDDYIFIDQTSAVMPLQVEELEGMPDTYPFGV